MVQILPAIPIGRPHGESAPIVVPRIFHADVSIMVLPRIANPFIPFEGCAGSSPVVRAKWRDSIRGKYNGLVNRWCGIMVHSRLHICLHSSVAEQAPCKGQVVISVLTGGSIPWPTKRVEYQNGKCGNWGIL